MTAVAGPASRHALGPGGNGRDDVLIARQPIVGMLQHDVERVLGELLGAGAASASREVIPAANWAAAGVRHALRSPEGEGHWDFYKPWTGLMLSVTDAQYRTDTWIHVQGTGYFKLRILLSGALRSPASNVVIRAPAALLYVSPGESSEGYTLIAGEPVRMVILHCRPTLLTQVLGLDRKDVPPPLDALYGSGSAAAHHCLTPGVEVIDIARRILESRQELSRALRDRYLQTLSIELLLQVLGMLDRSRARPSDPMSGRDAARIFQARDHLARHYANPPSIADLARLIGINRTKLKEGFRQMLGTTVYDFIVQKRMQQAAEMLLNGEHGIAQVAYAVGYDYPANFTAAFKRHFGQLPRAWKSRHPDRRGSRSLAVPRALTHHFPSDGCP